MEGNACIFRVGFYMKKKILIRWLFKEVLLRRLRWTGTATTKILVALVGQRLL